MVRKWQGGGKWKQEQKLASHKETISMIEILKLVALRHIVRMSSSSSGILSSLWHILSAAW